MGQRRIGLGAVEFLVLDEADRMLDMGFVRDVRKIVAALPKTRQTLLFSATMPGDVARLSGEILSRPVRIAVTPQAPPIEPTRQHREDRTISGCESGPLELSFQNEDLVAQRQDLGVALVTAHQ